MPIRWQACASLLILLSSCAHTKSAPNLSLPQSMEGWRTSVLPKPWSDEATRIANSMDDWQVSVDGSQVVARGRPYPKHADDREKLPFALPKGTAEEGLAGDVQATKVVDGWLVGFDGGEFGAALWWFSPDGRNRQLISSDQIQGFVETDVGLFALEGLGHLLPRGQVIRLIRSDEGKWRSERLVDLAGAPEAWFRDADGSLVIAVSGTSIRDPDGTIRPIPERLMRVRLDGTVNVILESPPWVRPNSLVVDKGGVIYIGDRGGVTRVVKDGSLYSAEWLTPPS